jgi:murein DD-endopeptidase MepM/ murein hydrolase activator NlpD
MRRIDMSAVIPRVILFSVLSGGLAACAPQAMDWDLRGGMGGQLDTRNAALNATQARPRPDDRGVLSYPGYQVVLARRGDTVRSVANRINVDPAELARHNALQPDDLLRSDEVLALPRRIEAPPTGLTGPIMGGGITTSPIDVTSVASGALDRAGTGTAVAGSAATAAPQPTQHQVRRGETAYSIARTYNVSVRSLADWNGLGPDLSLREGQYLMIPVATTTSARGTSTNTGPGVGSPTPIPPSAAQPLPSERTSPAAAATENLPKSPELGQTRTAASASEFVMPVDGKIIRGFAKGKNEGIDIAAAPGTSVRAAASGEVAAVTKDTDGVPILVLRHAGNTLSVYAGIDGVKVAKGASVRQGQTIATVRNANPSFVHFEVRKGVEAIDPMTLLR